MLGTASGKKSLIATISTGGLVRFGIPICAKPTAWFAQRRGFSPSFPSHTDGIAQSSFSGATTAHRAFSRQEAAATAKVSHQEIVDEAPPLVYQGVIFDMDGTLSVSCIDYVRMRQSLDIPVGDLFTVMETWPDGDRIKRSLDIILDIEAEAAAASDGMPGLLELLEYLKCTGVKVGLVTRNTPQSVDAFFAAIGEQWREVFDILLTREHPHVKPDKRCLLYFAEAWNVPPYRLLMVGDSTEDVECGNAAGTATCLIAGGGNEVEAEGRAPPPPPPGAVPTFAVESLMELQERLRRRDTALGWGGYGTGTMDLSSSLDSDDDCSSTQRSASGGGGGGGGEGREESFGVTSSMASSLSDSRFSPASSSTAGEVSGEPGAPPPGLDFVDWLLSSGAIEAAACSFPRLDGARFGVPPDEHPGSKVLHLQCGSGALTKLLFSAGLLVVGADPSPHAATKRGLFAAAVPTLLEPGALRKAEAKVGAFDAIVLHGGFSEEEIASTLERELWTPGALRELSSVLKADGKLCVEMESGMGDERRKDNVEKVLSAHGFELELWESVAERRNGSSRVRLIASAAHEK